MGGESWVESAAEASLGRPLRALPFCVFRDGATATRVGVGIGDQVLDLGRCVRLGSLDGLAAEIRAACDAPVLNRLIACGAAEQARLRQRLLELLGDMRHRETAGRALVPLRDVVLERPVDVPNYTDFYASIEHAERVGRLFRPEQPLLPNYRHLPIGYHGRASSIVVSGTAVTRPWGQVKRADEAAPRFAPSAQMDYEMEIGAYMLGGNTLGEPIPIGQAAGQIFGLTLVNDWSARDLQAWEYQPLGPFLGKSFATSVSPWVVPMAALEAFQLPARARGVDDPELLEYLTPVPEDALTLDVTIEARLATARMRATGIAPVLLGRSRLAHLYWTLPQMIAHHTSNGCNLVAGDLLATGTISGADERQRGCLLEITERGVMPLALATGEVRTFLEDDDELTLSGSCEREGAARVGLGECRGRVLPARSAKDT